MRRSERIELFNRVRAKYSTFLTSVLWKLTGDRELFAEAMQYALLAMWQRIEKLDDDRAGGYIYRIALSANSKAWRNRLGRDGHINAELIEAESQQEDLLSRKETSKTVRRAVAELPTQQSQAIVMRYLEEQDYETIAEKLNCSQAGARSHVSKAIAALKTRLVMLVEWE